MREVKRIRRFICSSGRCPHVISNRTVGVGFLALVLVCNGCLLLARYELSRDQALLDRAIAVVTALTRTTVAVSNSIGLPKRLSVKIVETAENISHRMVALSPDAAQLHLHKALVLIDFARIQREFGSSELERTRASQADSLLKGLAAKRLGDPAWQRDVSVAHSKLGDLLQAQNRLEEAYAHYDASRAILEGHAANSSAASKRALATSFMKMGDVDIARGSLNEALVNYDASLAIMDRLAIAEPGNPNWQNGLALVRRKIGDVLQFGGQLDEALVSYTTSKTIAERLVAADPGNVAGQRGLAAAHFQIGESLALGDRPDEALASYRASNAIARRFAAAYPTSAEWQHQLGISHDRIAAILEARNDFVGALEDYGAALEIASRLAAVIPENTILQRNLGLAHGHIGDVLLSIGDLAGALKEYQATRAVIDRLTAVDPRNTAWQYDLGISHAQIAVVFESQGDFASAVEEYEACLAIAKRLAANRDNVWAQRNLAVVYGRLATLHHRLGKSGYALTELQQGRKLIIALIESAPGMEPLATDLELFEMLISALEGRGQDGILRLPSAATLTTTLSRAMASAAEDAHVEKPSD